jgi:hypothetical protein
MWLVLAGGVATAIVALLLGWLGMDIGLEGYVLVFVVMCVVASPIALVRSGMLEAIDYINDRADAREDSLEAALRDKEAHEVNVDARTVINDNRSVTIHGEMPKEKRYGKDKQDCRRVEDAR